MSNTLAAEGLASGVGGCLELAVFPVRAGILEPVLPALLEYLDQAVSLDLLASLVLPDTAVQVSLAGLE